MGGVAPGSANTLANGVCSVNAAGATAGSSGNTASFSVPMTFSAASFGGAKNVYLNAFDNAGLLTHWVQGGTLTVQ